MSEGEANICLCGETIETNAEACLDCRADAAADMGDMERKGPPEDCL